MAANCGLVLLPALIHLAPSLDGVVLLSALSGGLTCSLRHVVFVLWARLDRMSAKLAWRGEGWRAKQVIWLSGGDQQPDEDNVKVYSLPENGEPLAVASLVRAKCFRVSTICDAALGCRYAVLNGASIPHPVVVRV